jgi:hypothetical protein
MILTTDKSNSTLPSNGKATKHGNPPAQEKTMQTKIKMMVALILCSLSLIEHLKTTYKLIFPTVEDIVRQIFQNS